VVSILKPTEANRVITDDSYPQDSESYPYHDITPQGMTNYDHSIDERFGPWLREAEPRARWGQYSAQDFCGYVWFDGQQFACEILIYGAPINTIRADTLEEIMTLACERYGDD
jgi:hypothetical protein